MDADLYERRKRGTKIIKVDIPVYYDPNINIPFNIHENAVPVLESYHYKDEISSENESDPESNNNKRLMAPKSKMYSFNYVKVDDFKQFFSNEYSKEIKSEVRTQIPSDKTYSFDFPTVLTSNIMPIVPNITTRRSINDIISTCPDGSVIKLPNGEYEESVIINKRFTLIGDDVVIKAPEGKPAVVIQAENVKFVNICILSSSDSMGIYINMGSFISEKCNINGNKSIAVACNEGSFLSMSESKIRNCKIGIISVGANIDVNSSLITDVIHNGIEVKKSSKVRIYGTEVSNISRNAIYATDDSQLHVESSKIFGVSLSGINSSSKLIMVVQTLIECCQYSGIYATNQCKCKLFGNQIFNCVQFGLKMDGVSSANLKDNTFIGCGQTSTVEVGINVNFRSYNDKIVDSLSFGLFCLGKAEITKIDVSKSQKSNLFFGDVSEIILQNSASSGAKNCGLISLPGAIIFINDCTFNDNNTGAVLFNKKLKLINSQFISNKNSGIQLENTDGAVIEKCSVSNNFECGLITSYGDYEINTSEFISNKYSGIHIIKSSITLRQTNFIENKKGGVSLNNRSYIQCCDLIFERNHMFGVSFETKSSAVFRNSSFIKQDGNAIAVMRQSSVTLFNCELAYNSMVAIQLEGRGTKLDLGECTIKSNKYGVVASDKSVVSITTTTFVENLVHLELRYSSFVNVISSKFIRSLGKAGLYVHSESTSSFTNCLFEESEGIVLVSDSTYNIQNCKFTYNGSTAVYQYEDLSKGNVSETIFDTNVGSGLYIESGELIVSKCQIRNHLNSGIIAGRKASISVIHTELTKNGLMDINRL